MKTSIVALKVVLIVFLCVIFAAGFAWTTKEAFAKCKNPSDANNYKTCQDCAGGACPPAPTGGNACDPDLNNDNYVTMVDLMLMLQCVRKNCSPLPYATSPYACYDLNGDTFVNMTDYDIVRKCLGCCSTPSPLK
jgi:hypothetical protein